MYIVWYCGFYAASVEVLSTTWQRLIVFSRRLLLGLCNNWQIHYLLHLHCGEDRGQIWNIELVERNDSSTDDGVLFVGGALKIPATPNLGTSI